MSALLYGPIGAKVCYRHHNGVARGTPPWFVAGCTMCEAKAAKDPELRKAPSLDYQAGTRSGRMRRGEPWVDVGKLKQARAARVRFFRGLPRARTVTE